MIKFNNSYDAFHFLNDHPAFKGRFQYGCLDINYVKVNPKTKAIDDDKSKNTEVNVWLECGEINEQNQPVHDIALDCGGKTYEEAIVKLANLVLKEYGNYEEPQLTEEELKETAEFFERLKENSKKYS